MQAIGSTPLARAIDKVVAGDSRLQNAHWGLVVEDDKGQVLYEHDADRLFMPASNLKLVTAAAASKILGTSAQFHTRLATSGSIDGDGVLHGDLCLVGGGDPSLTTDDLKNGLASLGIKRIEGNVVVDDHAFDTQRLGPGWAWDNFSAAYSAEADALTLDENVAGVHVSTRGVSTDPAAGYFTFDTHLATGSQTQVDVDRQLGTNIVHVDGTVAAGDPLDVAVTVHDPGMYAGTVLKWLCQQQGIPVTGQVVRGEAPSGAQTLWDKPSAPLLQLEKHMLKESDNLYAETLFRALASGHTSQAADKERQTLGLPAPNLIVDGSGLSRDDGVSPRELAGVLQQHYHDATTQDLLPIAGVDGTLRHRMPSLKGRVHAKTGTLDGVSTLSGWLTLKDGHQLAFSWMCNQYADGSVKPTEDALVEAIAAAES